MYINSKIWRLLIINIKFLYFIFSLTLIISIYINLDHHIYSSEGTTIYSGKTDEFNVTVKILPEKIQIGIIHFSIIPYDTINQIFPSDAIITLTAKHIESSEAYQVLALNQPNNLKLYSANITFDHPGNWEIKINIKTSDKESQILFPISIAGVPLPPYSASLVFPITFAILISGALYIWHKSYKR